MEKLNCSSCGGHLEVEENKEYAKCNHCGARYKLNKDLNVNIRLDDNIKEALSDELEMVKGSKPTIASVIAILIIGAIMCIIIFSMSAMHNGKGENKEMFNIHLEHDGGTKSAFFVKSTLDQIIESNKTHDRKVALVFEGKETTDEKEILDIKHSLSGTYEVSINYDDKGYVSKIGLEKLEQKSNSDYIQEKIEESEKAIESSNEDLKKKVEEMQEEARSFFDN